MAGEHLMCDWAIDNLRAQLVRAEKVIEALDAYIDENTSGAVTWGRLLAARVEYDRPSAPLDVTDEAK